MLSIVFRMGASWFYAAPELIRQTFTLYRVTERRGSGSGQIKRQINPCLERGGGGGSRRFGFELLHWSIQHHADQASLPERADGLSRESIVLWSGAFPLPSFHSLEKQNAGSNRFCCFPRSVLSCCACCRMYKSFPYPWWSNSWSFSLLFPSHPDMHYVAYPLPEC